VNASLLRSGKMVALVLVSVLLLLLVRLLTSPGVWEGSGLPWNSLLAEIGGRPEALPADGSASDLPSGVEGQTRVWPVRQDGVVTGVVVTSSAPGYRSRIHVAVALDAQGNEVHREIVEHAESPSVARRMNRRVDDLSGATITQQGISTAAQLAVTAGRRFLEEQR
jgi:Na+-translocating ferredoxin:NAD+ oxidoreductase RnfG subunit